MWPFVKVNWLIMILIQFHSCNEYAHNILVKWFCAEKSNPFPKSNFEYVIHELRHQQASRPLLNKLPARTFRESPPMIESIL